MLIWDLVTTSASRCVLLMFILPALYVRIVGIGVGNVGGSVNVGGVGASVLVHYNFFVTPTTYYKSRLFVCFSSCRGTDQVGMQMLTLSGPGHTEK